MNTLKIAGFSGLLAVVGCVHGGMGQVSVSNTDEEFRQRAPMAGESVSLQVPTAEHTLLPNGLKVLSVTKADLPLVQVLAVVLAGSAADPQGMSGMAGFTASMLKRGAGYLDALTLSEQVEIQGTELEVAVSQDVTTVGFTALKANSLPVLDIMAKVLMQPTFPRVEVERVRRERLTALALERANPNSLASRAFQRTLYGQHPYGHVVLGEESALQRLQPQLLQEFHQQHFRPANMALIVVGDVTHAEAVEMIAARFGDWQADQGRLAAPGQVSAKPAGMFVVNQDNASQSQLRLGHLGTYRNSPDYAPLMICNAILGGLFSSRINMNLREDKGYTYGARSSFAFVRGHGSFVVSTGVRTDVTDAAIREILNEIKAMRTADVTEAELRHAKDRYILSLPAQFQTIGAIASHIAHLYIYELPLDYYAMLPTKLEAVTVKDVRQAAERYLLPQYMQIVVVGDRERIESGLKDLDLGPILSLTPSAS